jgi:hypothetical protein
MPAIRRIHLSCEQHCASVVLTAIILLHHGRKINRCVLIDLTFYILGLISPFRILGLIFSRLVSSTEGDARLGSTSQFAVLGESVLQRAKELAMDEPARTP